MDNQVTQLPWEEPDWLQQVTDWIQDQLSASGRHSIGPVEVMHQFVAHPGCAGGQLANVIRHGRIKMRKSRRIIASILLVTATICLGAIAIESQTRIIWRS